jgi:hypothetical protein
MLYNLKLGVVLTTSKWLQISDLRRSETGNHRDVGTAYAERRAGTDPFRQQKE